MPYDIQVGAATIYMEASGEPPEVQRGVAHVLANRLKTGRWGDSVSAVAWKPFQFSCWMTQDPNKERLADVADDDPNLEQMEEYMRAALDGSDPDNTGGATHYYNPDAVAQTPSWVTGATQTVKLGQLLFFTNVQ
jgi:spore germination cell wall hydrolase CwlJ-like protein